MRLTRRSGWILAALPLAVVVLGLVQPLLLFLSYSVSNEAGAGVDRSGFSLSHLVEVFQHPYYRNTLIRTFLIATGATALTLVLGISIAALIVRSSPRLKALLIVLTVFPMLVGNVVRAVGWLALFGYDGLLNSLLLSTGVIDSPLNVLRTSWAVAIAVMSVELPIMVLTLYSGMELVESETAKAAQSLGAGPLRAFVGVTLPQLTPALVTGGSLVFVDSVNSYATPILVGGSQVPMIAPEIYDTVTRTNDWAMAAALAAVTMVISLVAIVAYSQLLLRPQRAWREAIR